MQIPFHVDSGQTPRKVEIERRKREYAGLARDLDGLLLEMKVNTQVRKKKLGNIILNFYFHS